MVDLGIVMPLYKQDFRFLKEAIQSIQSQTFKEFIAYIVVDGAPEMEPLVHALIHTDSRFIVLRHTKNLGVAQALNTGFSTLYRQETIKYLTWVSSDNVYEPSFLEIMREKLEKGPDRLGLVYSSFHTLSNSGVLLSDEFELAALRKYQAQPKESLLDSCIIGVSFMYKSKFAKQIEGYHMVPVEDYEYWLRLTERCDIQYIPVELMKYRVDSTFSVSSTLKTATNYRRWRYKYHLARHEARIRRNIFPEITLIVSVTRADEEAVKRIENVYEQTFSNYNLVIIDASLNRQATRLLSSIPHPRTSFRKHAVLPRLIENYNYISTLRTPYVMMLDAPLFKLETDLDVLVTQLKKNDSAAANSYTETHSDVCYYHEIPNAVSLNRQNVLFRTSHLAAYLKQKGRS
ncbi:glycosyltransferase family 2 protein [Paenibacillus sp. IB182496]|uniref:Glycosyltransferase family 2 protein n=1 Tax=Paenibacillus sabuli TaxID=2772509 RepID=A0A927BTW7_9BACL|nr:glycosyltransferase family 2 protein [Paenibacillus sabuli]MBD2846733.1 glycosyltransferase family 2 protein [Paenibacillus sabuli]